MSDEIVRMLVLARLERVQKRAGYWMARCPGHQDDKQSLSVAVGTDQPVVLKCFAGCQAEDILKALNLTWEQISNPRERRAERIWTPRGDAVAVYDYVDEQGELLYQVCRTADKEFPVRVPDRSRASGYRWSLAGVRRVLYRLPKVIEGVKDGEIIYITEGEKDVHALEKAGAVATCPPGGSNESVWLKEFTPFFDGACVRIVADKDKPGWAHAHRVFDSLKPVAAAAEIIEALSGKDAADHLAAGHDLSDFLMTKQSGRDDPPILAPDLYEFIGQEEPPIRWLIRDILERGDRLIWTGREGLGKSTIGRQLAAAAAAGIHPFDNTIHQPVRVLCVDLENPLRKSISEWRNLERVARRKGRPVAERQLHIIRRPEGIDLVRGNDAEWLAERVAAHRPDLLIIGPLYKCHATDTNEETAARAITSVLDSIRLQSDIGLIVEAHVPHSDTNLDLVRPVGSSLFMRWPDFGYGIRPDVINGKVTEKIVRVRSWRGPRDDRKWPRRLKWGVRGTDWPWIPEDDAPGPPPPGDQWTPSSVVD
jgi:hypothetical protein